MLKPLKALLLFLACTLPAGAEIVKCRVVSAKPGSAFAPFVGGKAMIDLENGNTRLVHAADGEPFFFEPISLETVSSFRARRSACNYGTEKFVHGDGTLRAMLFKFGSCAHLDEHDPALRGYVQADVGFDLKSNTGHYRELFLTPTGTPPSSHAGFQDCRIQ